MAAKNSGNASLWVWIPLGLALGLFVAFILFLDGKKQINQVEESEVEKPKQTTERAKPVFDFYTVLPDREVVIESDEKQTATNKSQVKITSSDPKKAPEQKVKPKQAHQSYILQVGSFNNYADADEMKARLAFLGLEGKLTDAKIKDVVWYRVHLGPFEGSSGLSNTKNLLIENNIEYLQKKSG